MSKNVEVSSVWIGSSLPLLHQLCIKTFLDHGHKYILYVYDDLKNIPEGVDVRDGNEILDQKVAPIKLFNRVAFFADAFRFNLLTKKPNAFWVDTDHLCISDDIPMIDGYALHYEAKNTICFEAFSYPNTCPIAQHAAAYSLNPGYILPWDTPDKREEKLKFAKEHDGESFLFRYFKEWYAIPGGFNLFKALHHFGLQDKITYNRDDSNASYFVHCKDWRKLYDGTLNLSQLQKQGLWGVHCYNEMHRYHNFNVLYDTKENSVIGELFSKHMTSLSNLRNSKIFKVLYCKHKAWTDRVCLFENGRFARDHFNRDGGVYEFKNDKLILCWNRWGIDELNKVADSYYKGDNLTATVKDGNENIICPVLSRVGRLGDCLWIIAACYAHALKVGSKLVVPFYVKQTARELKQFLGDSNVFESTDVELGTSYAYTSFTYKQIPTDFLNGGIFGWLQSSKYFYEYSDKIREAFSKFVLPQEKGTLGIHIRLGDKVNLKHYITWNKHSLALALKKTKNRNVFLCSDEPDKARKIVEDAFAILGETDYKLSVFHKSPCEDLQKLTSAEEFIGSGSGFSWWAAYLGRPRYVVMANTFHLGVSHEEDLEFFEPHWDLIDVRNVGDLDKKKIAVIYIGVGRYIKFFDGFYESCEKYFLPSHKKHYFLWTDADNVTPRNNVTTYKKEWKPWPDATLFRFEAALSIADKLKDYDYVCLFNANAIITRELDARILPDGFDQDWTVVLHPCSSAKGPDRGYVNKISCADVPGGILPHYFQAGFMLASSFAFLHMCKTCNEWYEIDKKNNVMPDWYDESYFNRYMLTRTNYKILDRRDYGAESFTPVTAIYLLDKKKHGGHSFLRSDPNKGKK